MMNIADLDPGKCTGCGACAAVCGSKAIRTVRNACGFSMPQVDSAKCIGCGRCLEVCPAEKSCVSGRASNDSDGKKYRVIRTADPEVLRKSSSGGAFSLIADTVLSDGGLVCGAVFDEHFRVTHLLSDNITAMRKSKYVQSDLTGCYSGIVKALKSGRDVLFTGTPCQCHGVRLYVDSMDRGSTKGRLITAALVCRGVLSPYLWEEYVHYLGRDGELEHYDFRDKTRRNSGHTVRVVRAGKEELTVMQEDPFCRIYLKGLGYRESCYACRYCTPDNDFDFIIGDCFDIEKICPAMADGMGASLVITGSEKAEEIVAKFSDRAMIADTDRHAAAVPALTQPAGKSMLNRFLTADLNKKDDDGHIDIEKILKKYGA